MNGLSVKELRGLHNAGLANAGLGCCMGEYLGCCGLGCCEGGLSGLDPISAIAEVVTSGLKLGQAFVDAEVNKKLAREQTKQIRAQLDSQALEAQRSAASVHQVLGSATSLVLPLAFAVGAIYLIKLVGK